MNSQGVKTINVWRILAKQANQKSYSKAKFITSHYFSYIHVINSYWMRFLWYSENNQGRGNGYQPKPKAEADNPYRDKSCFCFFTGKQHKACELDMITLRSHVPWSYMTWLPMTLSVLDIQYNFCSYYVMGADFENSLHSFGQSEKS